MEVINVVLWCSAPEATPNRELYKYLIYPVPHYNRHTALASYSLTSGGAHSWK